MGKDLNGRELGNGISQRADGNYMARFVDCYKKRHTFYGRDLKELRHKLEKAKYESQQGINSLGGSITLLEWFEEFLQLYKIGKVKDTTVYRIRQTFSPCKKNRISMMKLQDIRAIHVQQLINEMDENGFSYGTIRTLKYLLGEMFKKAIGNGYIVINPCDAVVMPRKITYEPRFLTEQEQEMFLEVAKEYSHYDIFCAALSFGGRIGDDDDKIRLNQRKPSKYKGLRRFGPEKNLQRINKFMKERPIFYKNLIQMKENIRFYLRCFYCITKVMILQFNSENRTELARNG